MILNELNTTAESTVFAVAWGPDSDQLVFTSGRNLVIKPMQVLIMSRPNVFLFRNVEMLVWLLLLKRPVLLYLPLLPYLEF